MAECMCMHAYLNRISDAEVNQVLIYALYPEIPIRHMHDEPIVMDHLKETSIPLTTLRQGLILQQGYDKKKQCVKIQTIYSLHDTNYPEFDAPAMR